MPILNATTSQTGTVGVFPSLAYIDTNDTLATILTTGYLNLLVQSGTTFQMPCIAAVSTRTTPSAQPDVGWFQVDHTGANWSLVVAESPGEVVLPTITNHIIVSTDTLGTLANLTGTAINNGSIQAGLSGTAGTLISFPATGSKGSLIIAGVANTGNTNTTLSNVAMGQASVVSIPDPANAIGRFLVGATATPFVSGNFPQNSGTAGLMIDSGIAVSALATTSTAVLLTPSADQSITIHNLSVAQGNLIAGSSGHAGTVSSFPSTAANGSLLLAAA